MGLLNGTEAEEAWRRRQMQRSLNPKTES